MTQTTFIKNMLISLHVLALAALVVSLPGAVMAQAAYLPGDVFAAIMLKSLNYDRNLDRHPGSEKVIGIICRENIASSCAFAQQIDENIKGMGQDFILGGHPVKSKVLRLAENPKESELEAWLKSEGISILVIAFEGDAVPILLDMTKKMAINSVCSTKECVNQGAGLGILMMDNKAKMLINLKSTKQEGSDYGGKFLALCEVIK